MKTYKTILIDLDGTIIDPFEGITRCVEYALNHWGIEVSDRRELCTFIGPPLTDSFMEYYDFTKEEAILARHRYHERFVAEGILENELYPGIEDLLKTAQAKGFTLALATSKPDFLAQSILQNFGLDGYFTFIGGSDMEGLRPDKAAVIRHVLHSVGPTDLEYTVMVGDRKHDVIGAKEVGIDSIGVLYGYGDREELSQAGADYIVEDIRGLGDLLGVW